MAAEGTKHGRGEEASQRRHRAQAEQGVKVNDQEEEGHGWRVNVSNIPSFVLYLAGAVVVAGILQESTGMGLPFALPAGLFVMVQIQKMMLTP